jgi:hypothetical protein
MKETHIGRQWSVVREPEPEDGELRRDFAVVLDGGQVGPGGEVDR